MKPAQLALIIAIGLTPALATGQNTRFSDPDTTIREQFWGTLYSEGGTTFFCDTPFTSKGFLVSEGYIYPLIHVRNALHCGTPRQCEKDERYRQIASDLHNIVPVRSRVEMRRRNAKYEQLTAAAPLGECGIREQTQFIEPPARIKGNVARAVAYMVTTYDLPWIGAPSVLRNWSELDPPDANERARHNRIVGIQGNDNPFVLDPRRMEQL
ncbi:endonuclease [Marinobacter mobilis]|uniref:Deoxyribonuclease-1 n=1 Tax=Marinobacter mobilis TaxID=488533 RepID=A0A1H2TB47_9GAMM|nr:endonuclease [Marinobacter mobilis]SDW41078.1 deoxyribonuclease-1 [Marinobacter mobilis]